MADAAGSSKYDSWHKCGRFDSIDCALMFVQLERLHGPL